VKRYWLLLLWLTSACSTSGNAWVREQYARSDNEPWDPESLPKDPEYRRGPPPGFAVKSRTLGAPVGEQAEAAGAPPTGLPRPSIQASGGGDKRRKVSPSQLKGKVLGTFRNTYYDFPSENDFTGDTVILHGPQCRPIGNVIRSFFEALCVQGSGLLASGSPVSFNRRDCECAENCPKTGQKICFDTLDIGKFPWGRGATGHAITPLLTVAVDSSVIALGTSLYIPEFDGLPRDASQQSLHDGCFIAQDRGLKVQGQHVDVFTGLQSMTRMWNGLVPSNAGVTVVVDSPRCERSQ
jgi:3D (Asp-Asp-Asp) domain-containing protein